MPKAVAEAVQPPSVVQRAHIVVVVEVGDVADLRDGEAAAARAGGGAADLQRAEAGGEIAQLGVGQMLVAEDQHRIGVDRGLDRRRRWRRPAVRTGRGNRLRRQSRDAVRAWSGAAQGSGLAGWPGEPGLAASARTDAATSAVTQANRKIARGGQPSSSNAPPSQGPAIPPSRPMPSAQPMPVLRTRAGYSAAVMPLIAVWLPTVQQPIRKITASSGR